MEILAGCGPGFDGVFATAGERAHSAENKSDQKKSNQNEYECDGRCYVGLPGGKPGEEDGESIFAEAESDVREWFGRGSDCGADCGFAAVGDEGDGAAGEGREELLRGREAGCGLKGEQCSDRDADEGVKRVPDEVERGDFVDEEVNAEENESGRDDAPIGKQMKRWRQVEKSCVGHQAEGGDGGIDIEPGREADGNHQSDELVGRQGHGDSIGAKSSFQLSGFSLQLSARAHSYAN
jgi:hypothetical protein